MSPTVFPNPVNNTISVKTEFTINNISIFSSTGLLKKQINYNGKENLVNVEMLGFEPGLYIIEVKGSSGNIYKGKFIKN